MRATSSITRAPIFDQPNHRQGAPPHRAAVALARADEVIE
jgi:hypothetical protein